MIKWDDKYSIGVKHLDEQHKKLFQYLNELEDAVNEDDVGHTLLIETLSFVEDYAKMHFRDEENCMHVYECPLAKDNHKAHEKFIEFFDQCRTKLEKEGYNRQYFHDILVFSEKWLVEHICKIDAELKHCVHQ